ncbi:putative membrane protein YhiD involved in acid resistance [Paenarthrobacter nicotinovorans]|uniref:Membrane protein YhiD involved in acid resistance n=1 Tax=Paenarthrobacter nicotinovorans TaxID=29320 RepID=A0ABT9TJI3_PAENI|nr:hypothetical protein [Paenarthrobacter nicotinovorans]MDQ0101795.1 putative membrane protein YhiD involved in acid resistance [Paenarthrobacter nicotinovorans]GAT86526.1 hypothetical protein CVCC1112_1186 [Paenarthrobacter nicotinovorans]
MPKKPALITGLRVSIVIAFGLALACWVATGLVAGEGIPKAAHMELQNVPDGGFRIGLDISHGAILGTLLTLGFIVSLAHLLSVLRKRPQTGA